MQYKKIEGDHKKIRRIRLNGIKRVNKLIYDEGMSNAAAIRKVQKEIKKKHNMYIRL